MAKRILCLVVLVALVPLFGLWAGGTQEAQPAPAATPAAQSEVEDWDAIYAAAKKEGKVVVYCLSSRIFDAVETFTAQYPEIEVEAFDMTDVEQVEKLTREQAAGVFNVDVLNLSSGPTLVNELLPQGLIVNYVPQTLVDGKAAKDVIPDYFQAPVLVHTVESKVVFYNFQTYPEPPVDSLWDLTRPEWRGKVQMKDPMLTEENMNFLQTVVQHADEMAKAYQQEFGQPIKLSSGIQNAGYEFIYRVVKNDLVLTTSDGTASTAVGTPDQSDPPLTLSVASSKMRDNAKGQKLAIAWKLTPRVGITKENYLTMANKAPHPNAGKLMIRWMIGDAEGGAGMKPWFVPGQWASRRDVKPLLDISLDDLQKYSWYIDPKYVYAEGLQVRDFWLGL
ncbi:MAG: ABC transporter substrate-binding protein [Spirochaetaceae bacterium]|nr:MAG: ABC transporter substrate-binding protein [Spirochaetaceae bacterium]